MPTTTANDCDHYYEIKGHGVPLVFVHGAFVDHRLWDSQFEYFAEKYTVIRYDLRGHGKTGTSSKRRYSIDLFAEDLAALIDEMNLGKIILCGLSLGGMIAQAFAVKHNERLRALILADTAVSVRLTWGDKFQRYILAPKWAMLAAIRWMKVSHFVNFSFKLAKWTRNSEWFGNDPETAAYVRQVMLQVSTDEYTKIYDAIYEFDLLELTKITAPTLILNGEKESRAVFRHTEEMLKWIPQAEARVIPGAGHTANMENPAAFNLQVEKFLKTLALDDKNGSR